MSKRKHDCIDEEQVEKPSDAKQLAKHATDEFTEAFINLNYTLEESKAEYRELTVSRQERQRHNELLAVFKDLEQLLPPNGTVEERSINQIIQDLREFQLHLTKIKNSWTKKKWQQNPCLGSATMNTGMYAGLDESQAENLRQTINKQERERQDTIFQEMQHLCPETGKAHEMSALQIMQHSKAFIVCLRKIIYTRRR